MIISNDIFPGKESIIFLPRLFDVHAVFQILQKKAQRLPRGEVKLHGRFLPFMIHNILNCCQYFANAHRITLILYLLPQYTILPANYGL